MFLRNNRDVIVLSVAQYLIANPVIVRLYTCDGMKAQVRTKWFQVGPYHIQELPSCLSLQQYPSYYKILNISQNHLPITIKNSFMHDQVQR